MIATGQDAISIDGIDFASSTDNDDQLSVLSESSYQRYSTRKMLSGYLFAKTHATIETKHFTRVGATNLNIHAVPHYIFSHPLYFFHCMCHKYNKQQ